jgi:hypothetical protein
MIDVLELERFITSSESGTLERISQLESSLVALLLLPPLTA